MNRGKLKDLELSAIAKAMIMVISMGHLIFSGVHVNALLLLENEICGFAMFLFVLLGLVTMFETTRIKAGQKKERVLTAIFALAASGIGYYLTTIYRYAVANQKSLEAANVLKAINFSTVIIIAYAAASVLLIADTVKQR